MEELLGYFECRHRPDTGVIVCRWLREVTPAEIQRSYEYLFAEARRMDSWRWLLDVRRRSNDDLEMVQWLLDAVTPLRAGQMGRPPFLAYLLSPIHLVRADKQLADLIAIAHARQLAHVALFTEEGTANEWLAQQITAFEKE